LVNKCLPNFMHIGLITTLFPDAKIVHCRRHPLDTCVSCYFQNFWHSSYTNNLKTLGSVYNLYLKLMNHWDSVLDRPAFSIHYEDLVRDPERSVRRVLTYCELPWDDRCLEFHRTKRVAPTASAIQIKSPIYPSSIGRWKNYQQHLQPLIEVLGEG
jgi:hypothetical protein